MLRCGWAGRDAWMGEGWISGGSGGGWCQAIETERRRGWVSLRSPIIRSHNDPNLPRARLA